MDPKTEALVRPPWIELIRLNGTQEMDQVAKRFFSTKTVRERNNKNYRGLNRGEFLYQFGIRIEEFIGYYAEIGSTEAPVGSIIPTKKIRPILCIRRSQNSANFRVVANSCPGFYSKDLNQAWVKVDDFENMLGDTLFTELKHKADKIDAKTKNKAEESLQ